MIAHADTGLAPALVSLTSVKLETAELGEVLRAIGQAAGVLTPDGHAAGVGCLQQGRQLNSVGTSMLAERSEHLQDELGEGPRVHALTGGTTVLSDWLGADERWSRFGGRAVRLGVRSACVVPLVDDLPFGWIGLYAATRDAFDAESVGLLERFANSARGVLLGALHLDRTRRQTAHQQWAATEGVWIERAVGLLMGRRGLDPDGALGVLRSMSQKENVKLAELARLVVDEAARRTRARLGQPDTGSRSET